MLFMCIQNYNNMISHLCIIVDRRYDFSRQSVENALSAVADDNGIVRNFVYFT